jgi:acyl carrier protein
VNKSATVSRESESLTMPREELRAWLLERVAFYLDKLPETIDPQVDLGRYGLDSLYAVSMISDIEDHLQIELSMEESARLRTIDDLTDYLVGVGV